jgi:hypothetical protein
MGWCLIYSKMNTDKSKLFTNKAQAEKVAKRRNETLYLLGKNAKGVNTYYVGSYSDAMKAKGKYKS